MSKAESKSKEMLLRPGQEFVVIFRRSKRSPTNKPVTRIQKSQARTLFKFNKIVSASFLFWYFF